MMHEYYDRETTIKQLNELQQLCYQTGMQTQQHSEVLQLYVLKEQPGQVDGVFKVVMYMLTSFGGPNEFIFFLLWYIQ